MGEVVRHEFDLTPEFWRLAVWDDVVDGDVPDQVQQAADQANHQDPDWKRVKKSKR